MHRVFTVALLMFVTASAALAQGRTFEVNGSFQTGGTFSGFFTLDEMTSALLTYNITSSAEQGFASVMYTSSGSGYGSIAGNGVDYPDEFSVGFQNGDSRLSFWLSGTPESFNGGSILTYPPSCAPTQCVTSTEWNSSTRVFRIITGGTVVAVPEPSSMALITAGVGALAIAARRRRRAHPRAIEIA